MDRTLSLASAALALMLLASTLSAQDGPSTGPRTPMEPAFPAAQPEALELPASEQQFRVYEVGDITNSQPAFPFSPEEVATDDPALAVARLEQIADMELLRQQAASALEALSEVVSQYMEPPLVEGRDELRSLGDNLLVLRASNEQHVWLEQFLETQRGITSFALIRTYFWTGDPGFLEEFVVEPGPQILIDTRVDIDALLQRAESAGHDPLSSPQLLVYPRQEGHATISRPISYVSAWVLELVAPDQRPVLDPVIEVVHEGVMLTARAVPLAPGHWSIDATVELSSLQEPIPTETVSVGDGRYTAEIARPVVSKAEMHSRFSVASGGGAIFLTHDRVEQRDVVVLIQIEDYHPGDPLPNEAMSAPLIATEQRKAAPEKR